MYIFDTDTFTYDFDTNIFEISLLYVCGFDDLQFYNYVS